MKAAIPSTIVVYVAFLFCVQSVWLVHAQSEASVDTVADVSATSGESTASAVAVGTSDGATGSTSCFTAVSGDASAEVTATAGSSQSDCGELPAGPVDSTVATTARTRFCENNCLLPILGGDSMTLPSYCERLCPDYNTSEELLDPNAVCLECPGTCYLCRCDTGACIQEVNLCDQKGIECAPGSSPVSGGMCGDCRPRKHCHLLWWCK